MAVYEVLVSYTLGWPGSRIQRQFSVKANSQEEAKTEATVQIRITTGSEWVVKDIKVEAVKLFLEG